MSPCSRPHLESLDLWASGSRLDTGRRPLQGSLVSEHPSRVRLWPASVPFGNRYIGREGPKPDDHTTEWPQHRPLPWQTRNRPYSKFKGSRGVSPKFICCSSFISAPDVIHWLLLCQTFQIKVVDFKGGKVHNELLCKIRCWPDPISTRFNCCVDSNKLSAQFALGKEQKSFISGWAFVLHSLIA